MQRIHFKTPLKAGFTEKCSTLLNYFIRIPLFMCCEGAKITADYKNNTDFVSCPKWGRMTRRALSLLKPFKNFQRFVINLEENNK